MINKKEFYQWLEDYKRSTGSEMRWIDEIWLNAYKLAWSACERMFNRRKCKNCKHSKIEYDNENIIRCNSLCCDVYDNFYCKSYKSKK